MGNRIYLWLPVLLLVLALAAILVLASGGGSPREPMYQGERLSFWIEGRSTYNSPARKNADEAVRQIGTNAIPTLLRMVKAKDPSPVVLKLLELARKQSFVGIRYRYARTRHDDAAYAFNILGTNAASAVPELIRICEHSRYCRSREYAAQALGIIGPAANAAVPALLRNFSHTNAEVRFAAVTAIHSIGGDPTIVVPALKGVLKDPKRDVRFNAVATLRKFGKQAKSAIPELMEALQDPYIREQAENILWDLVPEKIAKPLVVEHSTPIAAGGVTTEALSRLWDSKLWTLIPQGTPVRCATYQSVGDTPLYLYRGLTQTSAKDHFLGHFEVMGIPTPPPTNLNIEVVYIIDGQQILLCARDYNRQQFLELRRVEDEGAR